MPNSSENCAAAPGCRVVMDLHDQVSAQQLCDSVDVFGHDYLFSQSCTPEALLDGDMQVWELEPGLVLYRTQVVDRCSIRTSNLLFPSFKLVLLLSGRMQVGYGRTWYTLDASRRPCALLVNLEREDCFMRQWQSGRSERKLLLSCTPEWMGAKGLAALLPAMQAHLAHHRWSPSRKAIALAEQLHHETGGGAVCDALDKLRWQSRALDLLHDALEHWRRTEPVAGTITAVTQSAQAEVPIARVSSGLSLAVHQRLVALREWMATSASDGLDAGSIAAHAGMSRSFLQRHFPEVAQGQSVAVYLRQQRLRRACQALETQGVDVSQAAAIAGYASVTHFAKAFRIAYGCAPSQWRCSV